MNFNDLLPQSTNTYRLWLFHGALIQLKRHNSEFWVTPSHPAFKWDTDRYKMRVHPEWDGKPIRKSMMTIKNIRATEAKQLFEGGFLHRDLYLPTFFKGELLEKPKRTPWPWERFDFIPKPPET